MSLDFSRGAHVCQLFETRSEQREVTLRFEDSPRCRLRRPRKPNPYYEAPAILANEPLMNASDAEATTIEAMLGAFRNAHGT